MSLTTKVLGQPNSYESCRCCSSFCALERKWDRQREQKKKDYHCLLLPLPPLPSPPPGDIIPHFTCSLPFSLARVWESARDLDLGKSPSLYLQFSLSRRSSMTCFRAGKSVGGEWRRARRKLETTALANSWLHDQINFTAQIRMFGFTAALLPSGGSLVHVIEFRCSLRQHMY